MKVSIITVCFNSETTIKDAIESVVKQDYKNIEHIIIDGNSKDNTLNIINSYSHFAKIVSEPDKGIYDAMNKGIELATGDIIGTLNSDDIYNSADVISRIVKAFTNQNFDILYGDLYYVKKHNINNIVRKWSSNNFTEGSFRKGWHPPHPTFFVKKEVYNKYGGFNLDFKLAADFELMLRFLEKFKIKSQYLNIPMVKMRLGGATNKNFKNIFNQNIECYRAFKENSLKVTILYPFYRILPKFLQYFRK